MATASNITGLDDTVADGIKVRELVSFFFITLPVTTYIPLLSATSFRNKVEQYITDKRVPVLVTNTPVVLVVITVRQGMVVLLVLNIRISPAIVKLVLVESVVVISMAAGGSTTVNGVN